MADLHTFGEYMKLATKEDVLETARLLALNLAHYELKYGELPLDKVLATLTTDQPNNEQVELLNKGMQNLIGILWNHIQGFDERTLNFN